MARRDRKRAARDARDPGKRLARVAEHQAKQFKLETASIDECPTCGALVPDVVGIDEFCEGTSYRCARGHDLTVVLVEHNGELQALLAEVEPEEIEGPVDLIQHRETPAGDA